MPGSDASAACTLYRDVAIAAWDCRTCAGDARASWRAVRDGHSALTIRDGLRVGAAGADASALALAAARSPWAALAARHGPLAWSVSSSKGDPTALGAALAGDAGRFIESLPGMLGGRLARGLAVARPLLTCPVAAACSTGLYALLAAADLMAAGRCDDGLAGAVDASLTPLVLAGFAALGVTCGARAPRAFAERAGDATGFAPAEGAGFIALARVGVWRLIAGVRLGDASHETRFADPRTLARCLHALWEACPSPDLIVTHGTGTRLGDAYELAGLDSGPWAAAARIHCKPVIGHSLGASGAVELALALESDARRIWKISLGFGGHLAAVALSRYTE